MRWFQHALIVSLAATPFVGGSTAIAGHGCLGHLCHKCVPCCPTCAPPVDRGARREAEPLRTRAAEPTVAPLVSTMPVFAMPMMMPVMPAMATMPVQGMRGAEPRGVTGDCCDRVDELEREMKRLARSMTELQDIVHGQTEILKVLAREQVANRAAEPNAALKPSPAAQAPAK